jgi:hypothetical protein
MTDIVYTFSRKELLLGGLRLTMRRRETIMVMVMLLVLAVVLWIRADGFNYYSLAAVAPIPLLPLIHLYWINRIMRSNPLFGSETMLTFDENGLTLTSKLGKSQTPWASIVKYSEASQYFHLYLSEVHAITIPKRAFPEDQLEAFHGFVSKLEKR